MCAQFAVQESFKLVCLFMCHPWSSMVSCIESSNWSDDDENWKVKKKKHNKETITLTHIRGKQFIDAIVAVSTHFDELFDCISFLHWIFSSYPDLSIYTILHWSSASDFLSIFSFSIRLFIAKKRNSCVVIVFLRVHRFTQHHRINYRNTNETENNNSY